MSTIKGLQINDEQDLIMRAQNGDRGAFDELATRYYGRMLRTAMRITGNESEAEDAVQQAFLGAYRNLDRFRMDSAFSTWLTRITMNEALGQVRRRRKNHLDINETVSEEQEGSVRSLPANTEDPELLALRRERVRLVRESMSLVRPSYLKAMKLRLIEDLSVEEIGTRLGLPVNTVKVHLYRGRQAMKQYLEPRMARIAA
jgi:RNA polymerase sigma-70 factor (ECF subfamily)